MPMTRCSAAVLLLIIASCSATPSSTKQPGWKAVAALEAGDRIAATHLDRWLRAAGIPARVLEEEALLEVPPGLEETARRRLLEDPALGTTPFVLLDASGFPELEVPAEEGWVRLRPTNEGVEELLRGAPIPGRILQQAAGDDPGVLILGRVRPCLDSLGLWDLAWDLEVEGPDGEVRSFQFLDGRLHERTPARRHRRSAAGDSGQQPE